MLLTFKVFTYPKAYFVTIEFIYVIKLTENVNRQKKKCLIKY